MSMATSVAFDSTDILPLPDEVLTEKMAASLIVAVTASDLASEMGDEQMDKLQLHLRRFCLAHGAALIYTSARLSRNTNLLLKYILHRLHRLPFTTPHIVDRDAVFIPAGWDNERKLDIILETLSDTDAPSFTNKSTRNVLTQKEPLIEAEDDQAFLQHLSTIAPASPKQRKVNNEPAPCPGSTTTADGNSPLVSFFNNLLKTKDGAPSQTPTKPVANTGDAQSQLQRMLDQSNSDQPSQHQ